MAEARIAVIVASRRRPADVAHLLGRLAAQSAVPRTVVVVGSDPDDLPDDARALVPASACVPMLAEPGSCRQRNAGLDAIGEDHDIIVFYDDDYVPSRHALADAVAAFEALPDLVGLTGTVLADGVTSGGIALADAGVLVDSYDAARVSADAPASFENVRMSGLYGCNMAFRAASIGTRRFDERLPLYGWLEDIDFSRRVGRDGLLAKSRGFAGVHRGVVHGRSPGRPIGYSQVVNPIYLGLKGTVSWRFCLRLLGRNVLANHARALAGAEPWIDRRGRVHGNWNGFADLVRGRVEPERVVSLVR